jgi:DMSO/TMAO reductase YedYZ heme-binding membrane subunit
MYKNDTVVPIFALIFSIAMFFMTYLNGQRIAALQGRMPEELTVGQIGLMAFAMVLFIYGFIGLLSNWLEGAEMKPGKHTPEPSSLPVVAGVVLSLLLTAIAGFFARTLAFGSVEGYHKASLEGGLFAAMMLLIALLVTIYKKFFMDEEVLAEGGKSDFPW